MDQELGLAGALTNAVEQVHFDPVDTEGVEEEERRILADLGQYFVERLVERLRDVRAEVLVRREVRDQPHVRVRVRLDVDRAELLPRVLVELEVAGDLGGGERRAVL